MVKLLDTNLHLSEPVFLKATICDVDAKRGRLVKNGKMSFQYNQNVSNVTSYLTKVKIEEWMKEEGRICLVFSLVSINFDALCWSSYYSYTGRLRPGSGCQAGYCMFTPINTDNNIILTLKTLPATPAINYFMWCNKKCVSLLKCFCRIEVNWIVFVDVDV